MVMQILMVMPIAIVSSLFITYFIDIIVIKIMTLTETKSYKYRRGLHINNNI